MVPYVQWRLHDVTKGTVEARRVGARLLPVGFQVQSDRNLLSVRWISVAIGGPTTSADLPRTPLPAYERVVA